MIYMNNFIINEYFIYLLKRQNQNRERKKIIDSMKFKVLKANIEYFDINALINMLLNSDDELCLFFLENIKFLTLNKDDFYQNGTNIKFLFFKSFLEKCKHLYKKFESKKDTYANEINKLKNQVLKELQNGKINYEQLESLIKDDKEFENKIKLITSDEKEAQLLYNNLKKYFEKLQKDFKNIEIILDFYSTFYSSSKEELINLIRKKKKEYKENKSIEELINMDIKSFFDIKNFYLKEAIEESMNIKYKNSSFFTMIYRIHYEKDKLEKSEDKILKESINDYINTFKEIIEKLEVKESLLEINHINLIVRESLNTEFNIDKEINFINKEFNFMNKKDYLLNYFKNDFIFFTEQFQFIELIQGIISFIKYNYKINEKKETTCFNNLKTIYEAIIENKINEENINKYIDLLKSNEYYVNQENLLIKFYQALLINKESLSFLENIKYSIINNKDNAFLKTDELNKLIEIYIYFKKILNNKKIKSDSDFINLYNNENEKHNPILINFQNFCQKFYDFICKDEQREKYKIIENNNNNEQNNLINNLENKNDIQINNSNLNSIIVDFNYNSENIIIQSNLEEKMVNIINKFIIKTSADKNSIHFLYGGNIIKEKSILSEIIKREDKRRNKMTILVTSFSDNDNESNSIIKSKEVICPKCFEEINLKIQNYRISLYGCRNGHNIDHINLKDFLNTQNIDLRNIICNNCTHKNKFNSYNNTFYRCLTCEKNLCPLCNSSHEKSHQIIEYEKRNSICKIHFELYYSYCKNCKKNLCMKCEKEHVNHEKLYYGNIIPDSAEIKNKADKLGKSIKELNKDIEDLIERLHNFKENINNFYKIYIDVTKNLDNKNRNYEILNNILEISNNDIIKDIKNISEEKNSKEKFNLIIDISNNYLEIPKDDEITLIYKINNNDKLIKIFDEEFIKNNKNICKIIYKEKEMELKERFDVSAENDKLIIKLKGINKITNANKMFYECLNLASIPDLAKWNLCKVVELKDMFKGCHQSSIISNIFSNKQNGN